MSWQSRLTQHFRMSLGHWDALPLAHGFGLHYDLPVPLYLYLLAGGAVVALTFTILGAFLRRTRAEPAYPRLVLSNVPVLRAMVTSRVPRLIGATVGVLALAAIVVTGLLGATEATANPAEYLVWIDFWAGAVVLSGLLANLYALLNPFSALYDAAGWLRRVGGPRPGGLAPARLRRGGGAGLAAARLRRRGRAGGFGETGGPGAAGPVPATGAINWTGQHTYPSRLGLWPAVAGYLAFAWFELASGWSAKPRMLALAAILYTACTLAMMARYGRDAWLAHGEVFSVLFHLVGAFGPVEISAADPRACGGCQAYCSPGMTSCIDCPACFRVAASRAVALRPWGVGLLRLGGGGWDTVTFVILTLSSLAFDGLSGTPDWMSLENVLGPTLDPLGGFGHMLLQTAGLLTLSGLFLAAFALVVRRVERLGRLRGATIEVTTLFAFTLIPIALVYNAAHNYTYIAIGSQGLIPLLADPLQKGAHLLPLGDHQVSFALANAQVVWYLQIALIVMGHMLAVYVAHVRALLLARHGRDAVLSQLPMLVLMVVYTMSSLWMLAQPLTSTA